MLDTLSMVNRIVINNNETKRLSYYLLSHLFGQTSLTVPPPPAVVLERKPTSVFAPNNTPMPTATAMATPHVIFPKNKPIAIDIMTSVAIVLPVAPCATLITLQSTWAIPAPASVGSLDLSESA